MKKLIIIKGLILNLILLLIFILGLINIKFYFNKI